MLTKAGDTGYFNYLTRMVKDMIVQFVCFETKLGNDQFITQWEHYSRSDNSEKNVVMHQSELNGIFRYIAQHFCTAGELNFAFTKGKRVSRTAEIGIKTKQAGGYKVLQEERKANVQHDETKVFGFITDPTADLDIYRQLSPHSKLNIYQAYYENCSYAYILEFFIKNKFASELQEQLKLNNVGDHREYKKMSLAS